MNKARVFAFCLMLIPLLAACGDRGSGFSPAENAVTANPEETIDLRARDYELPPATPAPDGPTASYDTGDSSGGRTLTLDTLNPALERAAAEPELSRALEDALAENAVEPGRSTTIADETSEGDAAEVTGGDLNVVTDTADTITDTVVDPATGGEVEVEGSAEEVGTGEAEVEETAAEKVETVDGTSDASETTATTLGAETEDENVAEQAADSPRAVPIVAEAETGGAVEEIALEETLAEETTAEETGGAVAPEMAAEEVAAEAETGGATAEAAGSSPAQTDTTQTGTTQTDAQATPAQAASFDWQQLGETTYANCSACHQQNGQGIAGAFPPLAGHINELYNAEGGRKYIVNVVLYGLQGEIEVLGQPYNGLMAAWNQLSDEEIAATLNHELTSWGNDALLEDFSPILPAEVKAERSSKLTAAQVLALRPELP